MSKELDKKIFKILTELCENTYFRPTEFVEKKLEDLSNASVLELSHSLNNLQREGLIRIHIGAATEPSKVELIKPQTTV
jgi:hypothetical protein